MKIEIYIKDSQQEQRYKQAEGNKTFLPCNNQEEQRRNGREKCHKNGNIRYIYKTPNSYSQDERCEQRNYRSSHKGNRLRFIPTRRDSRLCIRIVRYLIKDLDWDNGLFLFYKKIQFSFFFQMSGHDLRTVPSSAEQIHPSRALDRPSGILVKDKTGKVHP